MLGIIIFVLVVLALVLYGITGAGDPADKLYKKIEKSFEEAAKEATFKSAGVPPLQYEMVKLAITMIRGQWESCYYHIPQETLDSLEKKGLKYFDMLDNISNKIGAKYVSQWGTFRRREREEQHYRDMDI